MERTRRHGGGPVPGGKSGDRAGTLRFPGLLVPLGGGVLVGLAAIAGSHLAAKEIVKILGALVVILAAVLSGRPKPVILFTWVVSLTYNRNYFLNFLGDHGSEGLYWNPSDLFLAALLGLWLLERIARRARSEAPGPPTYLLFLPFMGAALLSAVDALNPVWSAFEMARLVRVLLILLYVQYNAGRREIRAAIAGLAAAIVLQTVQGLVYVVTGKALGLAFFLGAGESAEAYGALMRDATPLAFRRAQGTLGHPNTLAVYLLLTTPMFAALALARRSFRGRGFASLVAVSGLVGLAATLSRTGWVLILGQMVLLLMLLVGLGFLDVRRALGITLVGGCLAMAAALPLADRIHQRVTGDLSESLDFRLRHDALALKIWRESPLTGVGLNNYSRRLGSEGLYEVDVMQKVGEYVRTGLKLRALAWVHNIYLLILAETGLVGLLAYLFFIGGAGWMAVRAAMEASEILRVVALGLAVGMLGVHVHGLQESVMWIDPVTYTFALVVGLAGNLRTLGRRSAVTSPSPSHRDAQPARIRP